MQQEWLQWYGGCKEIQKAYSSCHAQEVPLDSTVWQLYCTVLQYNLSQNLMRILLSHALHSFPNPAQILGIKPSPAE